MIVAVIVPILLGTVIWGVVRVDRTIRPVWRKCHDSALCLVVLASGWVREDQIGWGAAMRAEFGSVDGHWERWHFALGCLRTALLPTRRSGTGGRLVAGVVVTGVAVCTGLEVYGRVHYQAQSPGGAYIALFVVFVAGGLWMVFCRDQASDGIARRYGTAGGVGVGALFVLATTPLAHAGYAGALAVGCAVAATTRAAVASGDRQAGVRAGLWVGLISGLVFFIGLMILTYGAAGWFTHDAEAVAVFNNFRPATEQGHELARWPGFVAFLVKRESAVALLFGFVVAPLIAIASGALGGVLGGRHGRGLLTKKMT